MTPATCPHRQAEPVVLITGETVATVCVECLTPLPADYIDKQLHKAARVAFCEHQETIGIGTWSQSEPWRMCQDCDGFLDELLDAMTRPLVDPEWAAAVVPLVIRPDLSNFQSNFHRSIEPLNP